jgi:hypothetical protein
VTAARFTVVLLSVMIAYGSLLTGYPNIAFPWYLNTEEFPYIQEILRFSELDFRQQFFDIPGTPLMTLGTAIWSVWYWQLLSDLFFRLHRVGNSKGGSAALRVC